MIKVIELDIEAALSADTGVWEIALVEFPAIEQEFIYFSKNHYSFVYPEGGETKDEFLGRCMGNNEMVAEFPREDQRYAVCNSYWERKGEFSGEKVSFDWDGTLTTEKGIRFLEQERRRGNLIYIISARNVLSQEINALAREYNIPSNNIFLTGSNPAKIEKVKSLGIKRHYDDNIQVRNELGTIGVRFDYDLGPLPAYDNYPSSGDPEAMLVKPFLGEECGCAKQEFQSYTDYPDAVSNNAKRGIELNEKVGNRCAQQTGKVRAQQLANKEPISLETIKRMHSFLNRAEVYYDENDNEACGTISYLLWGGLAAKRWAEAKLKELGEIEMEIEPNPCYEGYEPYGLKPGSGGRMVPNCIKVENKKTEFSLVGYMDGYPIFSSKEEAEIYGESQLGCSGSHTHQDENGETVYMPCELHPGSPSIESVGGEENIILYEEWSKEDLEAKELFDFLKQNYPLEFEAITNPALRGSTEQQIFSRNHKEPTVYYRYAKVDSGEPTRDFCNSIEDRYFRISEIYALTNTNTQFGHGKGGAPYSKWLYKGGPNCVHAWEKHTFERKSNRNDGLVSGKPGTPPKQMPNNGYYSEKTKRASEVAYIISQQNMSRNDYQMFATEEDKRMIYTPLMIPNILIPRIDEVSNQRYYVKFNEEVIEKIQQKFMIEQRLRETNYEHSDQKFKDIVMVESWLVGNGQDKAYTLGFTKEDIPKGTWMAGYKILETDEGNEVWNKYIKTGKVKGASVEGNFLLNFSETKTDEYLLQEIINIIKNIY